MRLRALPLPCFVLLSSRLALGADAAPAAPETPPAAASEPSVPARPEARRSEITEVRVIGDRADALQKIPGSASTISQKEIERTQPYDAAEMLRRIPGVVVRQEEGSGQRLDIGVRGLDPGRSRRVLILEDGIPIAINPYAEPDLYYSTPIERVRGIEVVKGSGAILFGPQTVGGVINFITLAPPDKEHITLDVLGGEYGFTRALGSYGDRRGPVRYVAQVFHRTGDGFRAENFSATDAFAKMAVETSDNGQLTVKAGVHHDEAVSGDLGLTTPMFNADPRRQVLKPNDALTLTRYELSLIHEQRISDRTKLRTLLYGYTVGRVWRRQDYARSGVPGERYDRILGSTGGNAIYLRGTTTVLDRDYDVLGVEPRIEHRFETLGVRHTLETGARLLTETARYQQRAGQSVTSSAGSLELAEDHRTYAAAAYAQDRMAFTDTLLLTPGLRVEHATFRRNIGRQAGVDTDLGGTSSSTALVPGVGVVGGTRRLHVFGGLHTGYAPPRLTNAVNPRGLDQSLEPERNTQYEVGTRYAPARHLRAELTSYLSNFQNQIIASTEGETTALVNGGRTVHYGAETQVLLGIGALAKLPIELDAQIRYGYVRAQFVGGPNEGNRLPYSPEHLGTATLDAAHESGLGAQVSATYTGSQFSDALSTRADTDGTGRTGLVPSFWNLDFGARYKHAPSGLTARLLIKNILDDIYIVSRRPEGIATAGFRQVMLGLRYDTPADAPKKETP
jgi:Fe(3+) dicitrate transport protein